MKIGGNVAPGYNFTYYFFSRAECILKGDKKVQELHEQFCELEDKFSWPCCEITVPSGAAKRKAESRVANGMVAEAAEQMVEDYSCKYQNLEDPRGKPITKVTQFLKHADMSMILDVYDMIMNGDPEKN